MPTPSRPQVAIVGRPNVGKSSLLNAFIRRRVSIVHDKPGVTRDRVCALHEHDGRRFELVDMGGIGISDEHDLDDQIEMQINAAMSSSEVLIFVLDVRDGVTPLDERVARLIRRSEKPVVCVVNKADGERHLWEVEGFRQLGLGEVFPTSAKQELGLVDVMDEVAAALPPSASEGESDELAERMRVALVGQRNVGKSTLLNALAGEERVIVSEIPGTTRDAIDVEVRFDERSFVAIDTAGVRKRRKLADSIEFYSQVRSLETVRRADVVLHLIDATREVSQVDKVIAQEVLDGRKPVILVINKWDLAGELEPERYLAYLGERLPLLHYAPVIFVSAKQKTRLIELCSLSFEIYEQASLRISTPELNRVIQEAAQVRGPRVSRGKKPKIYFGTQVGVRPPWIVLFVNEPSMFKEEFGRFLANRFREAFPFKEVPLRISFRKRKSLYHD